MLCYLGTGPRDYREKPVIPYQRPYWEFQAVLGGHIAMTLQDGPDVLRTRHLWLSAPGHLHGWTGEAQKTAEVAVFHFLSVPHPLKQRFKQIQCLETPLARAQCGRLRKLASILQQSRDFPRPETLLRHEHLLLELSLLISESAPFPGDSHDSSQRKRVQRALTWFNRHIARNPNLDEVSRATGTSPAHLRRLFHEIMRASPKKIFDELRFQQALRLMASPDAKLSAVSESCGFESPSSFSRAFKNKFHCSPDAWRGSAA